MQKAIEVAKKIKHAIHDNHWDLLEDVNLHKIFQPLRYLSQPNEVINKIICYVIYAYDNDSNWINLNAERLSDKQRILTGIDANIKESPFYDILKNSQSETKDCIYEYLKFIVNWKWAHILACYELHSAAIQDSNQPIPTEITDEVEKSKIRKAKGEALKEGLRQMEVAVELLKEIKSDYVKSNEATKNDFGFEMTDEKKLDITSWKEFIIGRNEKKTAG